MSAFPDANGRVLRVYLHVLAVSSYGKSITTADCDSEPYGLGHRHAVTAICANSDRLVCLSLANDVHNHGYLRISECDLLCSILLGA